jgi:hypothetical protein
MSTTLAGVPEPSPVEAAREAVGHTRRLLFPFRFEHWLTLGLVAFLEQCGRGGVGGALPGPPPLGWPDSGSPPDLGNLGGWLTAHIAVIVTVAAALLALVVIVVALVLWIGSRATFVYIDDVATGRGELTRPWKAHAEQAQSYFAWRFGLAAALFGSVGVLVVVGVSAAILIAKGGTGGAVVGALLLVAVVPAFLLVLLGGGLAALALRDFVAPLQMHTGEPCGAAVRRLILLVRAHPLPFLLYVVLKVVFEMMRGMVLVLAACLTLCCILVPVVTQTALQPIFFFDRAWPLFFLRQMGHDVLGGSLEPPAGVGSSGGAEP